MEINFRAVAAVLLAVLIAYLAIDGVRQQSLQGSQLNFGVHTGHVELINGTGEPLKVRMTSGSAFTLARSDGQDTITSTRQGAGRNVSHVFEGELPAGNLELSITRGSDVNFVVNSSGPISATVFPRSDRDAQSLIIGAVIAVLGLLTYAAYSTREWWMARLRRSAPPTTQFSERVIE